MNDNVIVITCGEWAKEILDIINQANVTFKESGTLLVQKMFIYTNEIDEALKLRNENLNIIHDAVKHFNDLVNGIKESISIIESEKQPKETEVESASPGIKKVKVRNMTKMVQDGFIK